jgi:hypothetical protein
MLATRGLYFFRSTDSLQASSETWFDASWILAQWNIAQAILLLMVLWSKTGITGGVACCGLRLVQGNLYGHSVMKYVLI